MAFAREAGKGLPETVRNLLLNLSIHYENQSGNRVSIKRLNEIDPDVTRKLDALIDAGIVSFGPMNDAQVCSFTFPDFTASDWYFTQPRGITRTVVRVPTSPFEAEDFAFVEMWCHMENRFGITATLPEDFDLTLAGFRAVAGTTEAAFLRAVIITFRATYVDPDGKFRYFCGVVRNMNESAARDGYGSGTL